MSLAEKMVGIKAKTFLMTTIYEMTKKESFLNAQWAEIASELIHNCIASSFKPDEKRVEDQTIKFLQWMGFSPVDLKWNPDLKITQIFIGTSRIWREDPRTDSVFGVIMKALISALGVNFFHEKPQVEFIEENLPPRTLYGFELTERYGDISPLLKAESSKSIKPVSDGSKQPTTSMKASTVALIRKLKPIVEPLVGNQIEREEAAKILMESLTHVLHVHYPDVSDNSANILLFLFQRSAKDDKWKDISVEIGKTFAERMKNRFSNLSPNNAIKGLGSLNPEEIDDELLFYGKEPHQSEEFCQFIAKIWNEYINIFMPQNFVPDKTLCAKPGSSLCLFAFIPKS
ncbi:MAG: hypothetical protein ACXAC7_07185 [Candidatus Hodarchaeales archaeon]